jgi:hypothetical protein
LVEGARLGGLERKIASMISTAKTDVSREDVHFEDAVVNNETIRQVSWSELLLEYNHLKDQLEVIKLPSIRVQITDRELRRQVLSAERAVSYSRRIGRRAKSQV